MAWLADDADADAPEQRRQRTDVGRLRAKGEWDMCWSHGARDSVSADAET